jgi:hypothetical protein
VSPFSTRLLSSVVVVLAATACSESTKPSVPLADSRIFSGGGGRVAGVDSARLWVLYMDSTYQPLVPIIDTVVLRGPKADAVTLAPGDPGFAQVAALMTDGVDERIEQGVEAAGTGTSGENESTFLAGGVSGTMLPDLHGDIITSVQLNVDTLTFATPGSDPNHDGIWTDYTLVAHLIVNGYAQ